MVPVGRTVALCVTDEPLEHHCRADLPNMMRDPCSRSVHATSQRVRGSATKAGNVKQRTEPQKKSHKSWQCETADVYNDNVGLLSSGGICRFFAAETEQFASGGKFCCGFYHLAETFAPSLLWGRRGASPDTSDEVRHVMSATKELTLLLAEHHCRVIRCLFRSWCSQCAQWRPPSFATVPH